MQNKYIFLSLIERIEWEYYCRGNQVTGEIVIDNNEWNFDL